MRISSTMSPTKAEPRGSARTEPDSSWVGELVRKGLSSDPKSLPPVLFYDAEGSTLFERITELPEYYLTRTERGILREFSGRIVEACIRHDEPLHVIELGAGSADKSVILLEAARARSSRATYWPMDVSDEALRLASENVRAHVPDVAIRPIAGTHAEGLERVRAVEEKKLLLFIGSSIGNYTDPEAISLLSRVRAALGPEDAFLLGADRKKGLDVLIPAYDDASGVTARFNKNVLVRLNRELGAGFDVDRFRHVAQWNERDSCVSMFLESTEDQDVSLGTLGTRVAFARGERIHTENSTKYEDARLFGLLRASGFRVEQSYRDAREWFGLHLCRVA